MKYGHWDITLVGEFNPEEHFGFVYLVTNIVSGRKYIGKKSMWSTITKKVNRVDGNGKKNIKVTKESEWRTYTTSSKHINDEISLGANFTFQILSLHGAKGTLAYNEVEQLVKRDVLRVKLPNGDREYYNGCIPGIKFLPTEESYRKSSLKLKGRSFPHQSLPRSEETKRKQSTSMTGKKKSEEHKRNLSTARIGKSNGPRSEETKKKISSSNIGKHNVSVEERAKISERNKGREPPNKGKKTGPQTEEHKAKNRPSYVKVECPHCHIMIDRGNYARLHGDKCKTKGESNGNQLEY